MSSGVKASAALSARREDASAPRAAIGHMPFTDHRTCAEWRHPQHREREMTDEQRERDAVEGSAQLLAALLRGAGRR